MKGRIKRKIAAVLIASILVVMLLPMSVPAAAKYKFKDLKAGVLATQSYEYDSKGNDINVYYKITVAKPGRLTFGITKGGDIAIYGLASEAVNDKDPYWITYEDTDRRVAVDKGTYYLKLGYDTRCKYLFAASTTPTNYCASKAKALKAKTTVFNNFSPRTNFARWYRISNPKKKRLIYLGDEYTLILNSRLQRIATVKYGSDTKFISKSALPKGTYYIVVRNMADIWDESHYAFGHVTILKWQ